MFCEHIYRIMRKIGEQLTNSASEFGEMKFWPKFALLRFETFLGTSVLQSLHLTLVQ